MKNNIPRTPFSTALSGSAKETELRLKNIFSGPKKRPPLPLLALMFSACLLCGNLVSCRNAGRTAPDNTVRTGAVQGDVSIPGPQALPVVPVDPDDPPQTEEEAWLLQALYHDLVSGFPLEEPVTARLLASVQGDGCVLGAAFVQDRMGTCLVLGVMDQETRELTDPVFRSENSGGTANVRTFQREGTDYLLYTHNGGSQGYVYGEAGLVRFDGRDILWEWPVEGDVRRASSPPDGPEPAYYAYHDYWDPSEGGSHLALMSPGGVDVFEENVEYGPYEGSPPQWRPDHDENFCFDPSSSEELPMPIYAQARQWLEESTQRGEAALDYANASALWRIVSLSLNEARCEDGTDCYFLQARTDDGMYELTADLFFPYEREGQWRAYGELGRADVYPDDRVFLSPEENP